jgi:hypothetical protein
VQLIGNPFSKEEKMKALLFATTMALSLLASAAVTTPIDRDTETIIVENPTLEGKFFCGVDGRIIDAAVHVCTSQGYYQAQILERVPAYAGTLCWIVEPRGTSLYLELRQANAVLSKVKCTREKLQSKPPITQPSPIDPKPDPGNPYPVPGNPKP